MATFPTLKTGAVMQYPATTETAFRNEVLTFVDGGEHRYRVSAGARRKWAIQLDLLDEEEIDRIEEFFVGQKGRLGDFSFVDPADQTIFPDCSFDEDELEVGFEGELRGRTRLVIRQNRS